MYHRTLIDDSPHDLGMLISLDVPRTINPTDDNPRIVPNLRPAVWSRGPLNASSCVVVTLFVKGAQCSRIVDSTLFQIVQIGFLFFSGSQCTLKDLGMTTLSVHTIVSRGITWWQETNKFIRHSPEIFPRFHNVAIGFRNVRNSAFFLQKSHPLRIAQSHPSLGPMLRVLSPLRSSRFFGGAKV